MPYSRNKWMEEACPPEDRQLFEDLLEIEVREAGEEVPELDHALLKRKFMAYYFVKLIQEGDFSAVEPGVSEDAYGRFSKRLEEWIAAADSPR